ncbi:DUF4197 domain-containing protein [Erythrobacter sp. SDW2]|uniref:DUF4197 domain-containing protein n=1 Tax=Erythrobacter sp. SDW2 TaxID=2907154 RepID=UPI001F221B65|nr:DUF4197 domain-containing protein [Erythrobacter sp. SDW2]UIP07966.1 DUF4197 domain-containing protein [Erythrobacter sp. SDW2]
MTSIVSRRAMLAGTAATALLALPACSTVGGGFSFTEAIRRLLLLSSERAFARLTADGGFWDEQVARIGLGQLLGARGDVLSGILTSALFKDRLEGAFADFAIDASYRAAPIVTDAVRVIGLQNAIDLVRGGPSAATDYLKADLGLALVDAMVPGLTDAIRIAEDPLVGQAINALTGINVSGVATRLGNQVNDAIWNEMGREEALIRSDPQSTRDPLLIGVFGVGSRL